jgi:DNA polymerase-3 subunit epsilon
MKVTEYSWWGEPNEPPPNLKTKKQLAELGLKPKSPVGVIETRKYDVYLYDPENPDSAIPKKKATIAQLKALAKGREVQLKKQYRKENRSYYKQRLPDKNNSIEWARNVLTDKDNYVILDTETTGLYKAEVVQIGVINIKGEILLSSLIKPTISIPSEASNIHGIIDDRVTNAPNFPEIYFKIVEVLKDKIVLIYNAEFDTRIISYCCQLHNLKELNIESDCIMEWYAQYYGDWSDYYNSYKSQPLQGNHSAIGDCLAALKLIKEMATTELIDIDKVFERNWLKYLERHIKSPSSS